MPVVGERPSKALGESYKKNPLYKYMSQFSEVAKDILDESGYDIFTEGCKVMINKNSNESLKKFFVENSFSTEGLSGDEIEDQTAMMEAQYDNDKEALFEHTSVGEMNPVIGLVFPLHKNILMNMVFDKGGIPKVVSVAPKFTISMETRILVAPDGTEIDMFKEQAKMTPAIESAAPLKEFDLSLPEMETTEILVSKMGGTQMDNLSIETSVSAVKLDNVYFEVGDILPDPVTGTIEPGGKVADSTTAGNHSVWYKVFLQFAPGYGDFERTLMSPVSITHKNLKADNTVEIVTTKDVISAAMNKNKFNINAITGNVKAVRIRARLDTSNAMLKTCSVKWKVNTDIVEIPSAIPVNTTVSPEEVKDISALYQVNQLTKIMSLFKTTLGNYKDDKIHMALDDSFARLDPSQKNNGTFDFAVREGFMLDHVEWRHRTFMDYFDSYITKLLQVLNDPNMTVTVYGNPDIVRKITPTEYTYQTPSSIGPVELDFVKTVTTSDKRTYQFIASDKLRNTTEFIVVLCPRNSDRIIYRIYDYQLYVSNEIRNAANTSLPAIHAFERWKFVEYQPVQGRLTILNPTGIIPSTPHI